MKTSRNEEHCNLLYIVKYYNLLITVLHTPCKIKYANQTTQVLTQSVNDITFILCNKQNYNIYQNKINAYVVHTLPKGVEVILGIPFIMLHTKNINMNDYTLTTKNKQTVHALVKPMIHKSININSDTQAYACILQMNPT